MNARTRTCEQQQLNALRMLAACPHGATALALLRRCLTKLVACGYCDREARTGRRSNRYRITPAGQEAASVVA
jgi:hypothetical protein